MKKITKLLLCLLVCASFTTMNSQTRNTLAFDGGAESYVDAGSSANYSPAVFTIETWVKISAAGGNIISNVEGGADTKGFDIRLNGQSIELVMAIGASAGYWYVHTANEALPLDTWTHIAVTYDGANSEIFYNGVSKGISANSNSMFVSSLSLLLGRSPTYGGPFTGQLSDVRLWNDVRTTQEIQDNMNSYVVDTEANLVGNWRLDEGSGTTTLEQVTDTNATLASGTSWILNQSLSINDVTLAKSFSIYPNPSNGVFKVKSSINETVFYNIYTITGKLVKTGTLSKIFDSIDLSNNSQGLYVLKGSLEGRHFIKKLIVN